MKRPTLTFAMAAITVIVGGWSAGAAGSTIGTVSASELPSAFTRPPTAADQLPPTFNVLPGEGRPFDSRRIATLSGTKHEWRVYLFKQKVKKRVNVCLFIFTHKQGGVGGAGGGCGPPESFFSSRYPHVTASATGRVLAGVTSDRVAKVAVIGSQGVAHDVPLTRDHGFIFNCRAYNGCACVIARVQAFDRRGHRIANQDWRSSAPNCRRR